MKKSLKKGGIADIVTLVIIVGIVLALIVAVVVPYTGRVTGAAEDTGAAFDDADYASLKDGIGKAAVVKPDGKA